MKKIGLVGGIGPASTVEYYMGLVKKSLEECGEYPQIVIDSVNMLKHDEALNNKDYDSLCEYLLKSIDSLKAAGAELAAITANSEHVVWDMMCDSFSIPTLSIVEAATEEIIKKGFKKVVIFGTGVTLKSGIYENALKKRGIIPVIPDEKDADLINSLIYPNLENGIVIDEDKQSLIDLAEKYIKEEVADALLLACTELSLAIKEGDISVPALDTTQIHIDAIFQKAME